jgi:hypothetical protein
MGIKDDSLAFHPSFKSPYGVVNALEFENWFYEIVEKWDFETLTSAHNCVLFKTAKERVTRPPPPPHTNMR